jgi:hypothetical protein
MIGSRAVETSRRSLALSSTLPRCVACSQRSRIRNLQRSVIGGAHIKMHIYCGNQLYWTYQCAAASLSVVRLSYISKAAQGRSCSMLFRSASDRRSRWKTSGR